MCGVGGGEGVQLPFRGRTAPLKASAAQQLVALEPIHLPGPRMGCMGALGPVQGPQHGVAQPSMGPGRAQHGPAWRVHTLLHLTSSWVVSGRFQPWYPTVAPTPSPPAPSHPTAGGGDVQGLVGDGTEPRLLGVVWL